MCWCIWNCQCFLPLYFYLTCSYWKYICHRKQDCSHLWNSSLGPSEEYHRYHEYCEYCKYLLWGQIWFEKWQFHLWLDILDVVGGDNCCLDVNINDKYFDEIGHKNILMNLIIMTMVQKSIKILFWDGQLRWWS